MSVTSTGTNGSTGGLNQFLPAVAYALGSAPVAMALGDVNHDGHPDVIAALASSIAVLLGAADGSFAPAAAATPLASPPTAIATGDFNSDGFADVVLAQSRSSGQPLLSLWLGRGDGTFQLEVGYPLPEVAGLLSVAPLIVDGGLGLGVVAVDTVGDASIFEGDGQGHLSSSVAVPAPPAANSLVLADFLQPGHLDALISAPTALSLVPNLAQPTTRLGFPFGPQRAVATGDLDRSGRVDFVTVSSSNNTLTAYLNDGGGEFIPQASIPLEGTEPGMVVVADFDGDTLLDAAVGNLGAPDIAVVLGNGTGGFYAAGLYPLGATPMVLLTADLNGDQRSDLLVLESACGLGQVEVLFAR